MIELNPFRNNDSPGIAAVWSQQLPLRGRFEKLTTTILEQHILSKPYFDPRGLIVAHESDQVVGFVHVGFSPGALPEERDHKSGVISQLMVVKRADATAVAASLLNAGESLLRESGATELLGGGYGVHAPFYLGLYGGCRLPGVLVEDVFMTSALKEAGYAEHLECVIWQRSLTSFRPPIDRDFVTLRRQFRLQRLAEEPVKNWNDACAYSWSDPKQFGIDAIASGTRSAMLTFWNMDPLASGWGQRTMGLADLVVHGETLRSVLLSCFLGEAMRQFQTEGVSVVEVQTLAADEVLVESCRKLGFQPVDRGIQFRKVL